MLVGAKKMLQPQTPSQLPLDFRDLGLRLAVIELTKASFIHIAGRTILSRQLCTSRVNFLETEGLFPVRLVARRLLHKSRHQRLIWLQGHLTQG